MRVRSVVSLLVAVSVVSWAFAQSGPIPAEPEKKADEPKKPRKIAHGGCYYPFPVKESDPKEPLAKEFSLDRSAEYLDSLTRQWNQKVGCVSCHTTFSYLSSRPTLKNVPGSAMAELREFMEYRVANWKSDRPLWDAEVLITATSLAVHDSNTTGKLQPQTRKALERMWGMQRQDGAWNWLKAATPPFEHDDYYGAVLVAVGVGHAPKDYATSDSAKDGMAKLRQYFAKTPPPSLHHAAWLIWASAKLEGLMTKDQRDQKVKELVALQKPDGGWSLPSLGGWKGHDGLPIDKAPSDGYATGLLVFALRQAGLPPDHDAVRKGVQWLKANQRESGSWFTGSLGTRYHLNFMSHSGTAFAVMALMACEDAAKPKYVPDLVPGRAPTKAEVAAAEKDVAAHPDDFHLVRKLGKAYFYRFFGAGEKEAAPQARKTLERADELKKNDAETIAFLGALARLTGRQKEGDKLFKQAQAIDPDNMGVLGLLSGFGDVAAMERLRKLPGFAEMSHHGQQRVLLGLGKDRARKGEAEKARAIFEEGLKLNQETPEARMLKAALDKLN